MGNEKSWRETEPSLKEVISNHKDVSPFVIIKIDAQRRGVKYTERALKLVDPEIHQLEQRDFSIEKNDPTPVSLLLRDGTSIVIGGVGTTKTKRDPYIVDAIDGKPFLIDNGEVIEEVEYWEKPDYYNKLTSSGKPMWQIVGARPQRLHILPSSYCHFWDKPGNGCKYCGIGATYRQNKDIKPERLDADDVAETIAEAIKQPGRFTSVMLTGGSILSGKELLDDEVDFYIEILQAAGKSFKVDKFPSQLNGTAFNEKQLRRLYENTGLTSYTTDLEVFDEEKFKWICPGKAEFIGYDEWKNRLYKAVEIFGRGNVNTGIVGGVELAAPYGFKTEEEALQVAFKEADELGSHGISVKYDVWNVVPGSIFFKQTTPSLEYFVRLTKGFDDIRRKYDLSIDMDDYRRCGNHPNIDLARI